MNKYAYLGLSMSQFGEKVNLCYMGVEIFILYIKTDYIYKDVSARFDTINYELPLLK